MTLIIDKKWSAKDIKDSLEKIVKKNKPLGLKKHFGLSNEKVDALEFQKKARDDWN